MSQLNGAMPTSRPSMDELDMIRDYIMYPHIETMMHKSLDDMSFAHVTLKNVIIRCLEHIMFAISADYRQLKQEMRLRGIKVVEEEVTVGILYVRYYCRGYEEKFGIVRENLRSDIIRKLTSYTNDLGKQLKNQTNTSH